MDEENMMIQQMTMKNMIQIQMNKKIISRIKTLEESEDPLYEEFKGYCWSLRKLKKVCKKEHINVDESRILDEEYAKQLKLIVKNFKIQDAWYDEFVNAFNARTFTIDDDFEDNEDFNSFRNILKDIVGVCEYKDIDIPQNSLKFEHFEILEEKQDKEWGEWFLDQYEKRRSKKKILFDWRNFLRIRGRTASLEKVILYWSRIKKENERNEKYAI